MMPAETSGQPEQRPTPRMMRFGDAGHEVIHPAVAERLLIEFKRTNPKLFGRLLQAAMVPESVSPSRRRGKPEDQADADGQAGD